MNCRQTLLTTCLALALATTPGWAQDKDFTLPNLPIEAFTLPNGLKVVLHRDQSVPRVTVCMAYHVGSKNESAGRTGFAHFFEHMMFRGTKNVPNYDIPLQETGAQSNAFTSEDLTVYYETVPTEYIDRALYLEAERLAFLPTALDQTKFDTEREVVKNERRQSVDNVPYGLAEEAILRQVFPAGHPYSWSVIGSMKDLGAASTDDLRRFFGEFYSPNNAALCLAGDFDPAEVKKLINLYFTPIPPGPAIRAVAATTPPLTKAATLTEVDKVSQPRVYWAWPTVADDHPDAPALHLLASVLTDGEASRFYRSLVEDQRVVADVDADSDTKEIAGLFTLEATAAKGKSQADVEAALAAAVQSLARQPATAAELIRAQAKFERQTFNRLTAPLGRATMLAIDFVEHGRPDYYRVDYGRYARVTAADLARVAQQYLTLPHFTLNIVPAQPGQEKSDPQPVGPLASSAVPALVAPRVIGAGPNWGLLPGPEPTRAWLPPTYVKSTLSNGVELWTLPWRTLPIVEVRLLMPIGSGDDPAGKSGLAYLTANLLDNGTKTKSNSDLTEQLDALGASLNTGASADNTTVALTVLARNLKPALALMGEVLTAPRFDPKDFDLERGLQLDDIRKGPDSPRWLAQRALQAILFGPEHPYGNPAQGFESTVAGITLDDIRNFHKGYAANRAKLVVVGDVEPAILVTLLEETMVGWKTTGPEVKPRPIVDTRSEAGKIYVVDKPGAVQSIINVARLWVDRSDPRYFATKVGNHIVGDDFLSRLNANLREKNGFSYGAGSNFGYRRTGSVWQVNTSVRADVTAEALGEILNELDGLAKDKPLSDDELETARAAEAKSFPESFDDPSSISAVMVAMASYNLADNFLKTYLLNIMGATDAQVREAILDVIAPPARRILIVGDKASIVPKLKAAQRGEVRVIDVGGKPVTDQ